MVRGSGPVIVLLLNYAAVSDIEDTRGPQRLHHGLSATAWASTGVIAVGLLLVGVFFIIAKGCPGLRLKTKKRDIIALAVLGASVIVAIADGYLAATTRSSYQSTRSVEVGEILFTTLAVLIFTGLAWLSRPDDSGQVSHARFPRLESYLQDKLDFQHPPSRMR